MIGLAVGLAAGGFQFWLLTKYTKSVTGGVMSPRSALMGLLQFLLPLGVLLGVAYLRRQELLPAGIGIAAALIGGSLVKYMLALRKPRKGGDTGQ